MGCSLPGGLHVYQTLLTFFCSFLFLLLLHYRIASGTGIFTRGLLSHTDFSGDTIAEVRAIEPGEGMRRVFTETVHDTRVSVSSGTFDNAPTVPDGWADIIAIATVGYIPCCSSSNYNTDTSIEFLASCFDVHVYNTIDRRSIGVLILTPPFVSFAVF